jgi:hypothetical protein
VTLFDFKPPLDSRGWLKFRRLTRGNISVTFAAEGTTALDLKCTDETWKNPNWTQGTGEFYSKRDVKCTPVDLPLKPSQLKVVL